MRYRFEFNGKELDAETDCQDYGFRINNSQIGRFLSADPLITECKEYPELTPYQFASNCNILVIYLDGLEYANPWYMMRNEHSIALGIYDGVSGSIAGTWGFVTRDAWKAETWKEIGMFTYELHNMRWGGSFANNPRAFAVTLSSYENVIDGNAYTRTRFVAGLSTDILTGYFGDKGLSKLKGLTIVKTTFANLNTLSTKAMTAFTAKTISLGAQIKKLPLLARTSTGKTIRMSSIRFSQNTVNDLGKALGAISSGKYDPIDVVRMADGMYTTIDNTRLLAAQKLGTEIKINLHSFDEALPTNMLNRFKNQDGVFAKTWG